MRRLFFAAMLGLLIAASAVLALDAPATIKKVDVTGHHSRFARQDRELKTCQCQGHWQGRQATGGRAS